MPLIAGQNRWPRLYSEVPQHVLLVNRDCATAGVGVMGGSSFVPCVCAECQHIL